MIYIYTLKHPITNEIRYVGKTVKKLQYRLAGHICEARVNTTSYRCCWIRSLANQGLTPIIELLDQTESNDWEWLERYWISQFKTWGFRLVNLTDGGESNTNNKPSKEAKEKRFNTIKAKIASGEISYVERGKKMSISRKGIKLSDITREKLRQANLGKTYSEESRLKKSVGGIYQYDLNMNLIEVFKFGRDVIAKHPTMLMGSISNAARGRCKTYKGFIWKYGKNLK